MDDGSRLPIIISVLLLFGAFYFAVAETAFAACSRNRIKAAVERNESGAKQALYILDHFDRAISTLLIGTNLCHLFLSALVTMVVVRTWGLSVVTLSTILTTLVVFFVAEMLPKSIAKKFPERLAKASSGSLRFFMTLFYPLSAALSWIGAKAAKMKKSEPELSVTEDELYDIIEDMTEEGSLDEEQGELISSALQFGDLTVESVLTPRVDLVALDIAYGCGRTQCGSGRRRDPLHNQSTEPQPPPRIRGKHRPYHRNPPDPQVYQGVSPIRENAGFAKPTGRSVLRPSEHRAC